MVMSRRYHGKIGGCEQSTSPLTTTLVSYSHITGMLIVIQIQSKAEALLATTIGSQVTSSSYNQLYEPRLNYDFVMKSSLKKPLPQATVTTFGISYPARPFLVSNHSAATQILIYINQHLNVTVHCGNGSLIKILYSAVLLLYSFKVIS